MTASDLGKLKCATRGEVKAWLQMHVKTNGDEKRRPVLDVFCEDGVKSWCEAEAKAGRCIREAR